MTFSPNGRYIATGSWDARARVFEAHTGKLLSIIQLQSQVEAVAFSPDGSYLCVGGNDNFVRVSSTSRTAETTGSRCSSLTARS